MNWTGVRIAAAVVLVVLFVAYMVTRPSAPQLTPAPQQTAQSTFTWEGTTWDCGQVAAWDAQYGAYEPDGTPIPYEVVTGCDG